MIVSIVLNSILHQDIEGDYFIGVDGGIRELLKQNLMPNLILGDFDSFNLKEKINNISIIKYSSEKDFSDGEAAVLEVIKRGYKDLYIYGIEGGRLDHIYANIYLILLAGREGLNVKGVLENGYITYYKPGKNIIDAKAGDIVSVFASNLSIVKDSEGLKYRYDNYLLEPTHMSLGLSNEAIKDNPILNVKDGDGFIIVYKKSD